MRSCSQGMLARIPGSKLSRVCQTDRVLRRALGWFLAFVGFLSLFGDFFYFYSWLIGAHPSISAGPGTILLGIVLSGAFFWCSITLLRDGSAKPGSGREGGYEDCS